MRWRPRSPACCGSSCSIRPLGTLARPLRWMNFDWNPLLNGNHAMCLVVMAAVWKQISYNFLFFLAGPAIDPQKRAGSRRDRRRGPDAAVLDHHLSAAVADHVLPSGRQYRLRLLRHLRHHRCRDRRRPGRRHHHHGLQGVCRRAAWRRSRRLGRAIGGADGDRDRADRGPVQAMSSARCSTDGRAPPAQRHHRLCDPDARHLHRRLSGLSGADCFHP